MGASGLGIRIPCGAGDAPRAFVVTGVRSRTRGNVAVTIRFDTQISYVTIRYCESRPVRGRCNPVRRDCPGFNMGIMGGRAANRCTAKATPAMRTKEKPGEFPRRALCCVALCYAVAFPSSAFRSPMSVAAAAFSLAFAARSAARFAVMSAT